ncbi:16S rRNA methyltransferase G [Corynebacterium sp. HMSC06D04]|uniref:16S rRNA (guanine(527)-N(7))-methyltransferase RsmG n=1 Tax=Corynebacterium TaxID=1716 RepID=UPI0008A441DD|nr:MULTISPECIES: 16S rRNA (guanine(527)-N(7))-methyltransferase RsmG [unclassified Corynebacterium]MCK6160967.1 16S rRNA (guanine(527)-N(7))-methyltransferase RsmG [Corynebacterium simulans]MDU3174767.1 16S rRNA (guanine(527)-N(7))-methyltransferase RsmG [Corynebacterium striatum]OFT35025.1 16S rRNA methyltransferase G [Corynebacterium sp. HMSC08C04]OFT52899.1 16S rRNA methyltransferase G [Corynebacterium sp. HMSC06D04]
MSDLDPSEVFGSRLPLAQAYHDSLATDGSIRGFIGPREVPRLWERHLLNCAVIGDVMPEGARVIDVGSGAGLPGIPLAIARPDLDITLIEPLLKRSNYLSEVKELLGLDNVTVIRGRAEEGPVKKAVKGADIVTSRAVAPLGKLAKWSLPLVKVGGEMIALKGESVYEELERDAAELKRAGAGKAEVTTIKGTTIIRVPRVN